jgi:hypothetical protein
MDSLLNIKERRFTDSELQYYDAVFVAGGLWNMLNVWVENGFEKDYKEMTDIFLKIFHKTPW